MLELLAQVEPMSLPVWAVLVLSAAMYPLGFMLGAPCSECCAVDCECGLGVGASTGGDASQWCCSGNLPEEITIRLTTVSSVPQTGTLFGTAWTAAPDCSDVDGDYVLSLTKSGAPDQYCYYSYEPTCSVDCEEFDPENPPSPPIPAFAPGVSIYAYPGGTGAKTFFLTDEATGTDYLFYVHVGDNLQPPGAEEHCAFYYGVPGTLNDDPVLFGGWQNVQSKQFTESSCEMSFDYSETLDDPVSNDGKFARMTSTQDLSSAAGLVALESQASCDYVAYSFGYVWAVDPAGFNGEPPVCMFSAELV